MEEAHRDTEHLIVNLGAGLERVFRQAFAQYPEVARIGLPQWIRPALGGSETDGQTQSRNEHYVAHYVSLKQTVTSDKQNITRRLLLQGPPAAGV